MAHRPYIREVENSGTAVVFIHGIMGSPDHFLSLIPLTPCDYSIYNVLLRGHGGTVSDFCRSRLRQWRAQVCELVDSLCNRYENIIIVGHSMGTLFAIEQALIHPDKVKKLFLLATPLKTKCSPSTLFSGLKLFLGKLDPKSVNSANSSYSLAPEKNKLKFLGFIPRYLELFGEISRVKKRLGGVTASALSFHSGLDELVSLKSVELLKRNPSFDCRILEKSHHSYYEQGDLNILCNAYSSFVID
ncbi:MAG: alpha/beta hydrolase [Clostridia bacterium]|nr:alpha/beta hydrolase [Clostridia bacterium]